MKTTLSVFCESVGWQGGTLEQAKQHFAILDIDKMNSIASRMASVCYELSDPQNALWFMQHRTKANGLHTNAL